MSGYGNPRRGGGGRGRTSGRRIPLQSNKPVNWKKTVEEYYFYVGSSKQASDYKTTSEYIINYIKKTFDRGNDIAEALRTLVKTDPETWKPTLKARKEIDQADKDREDEQFKMEYKAELDEALKRKRMYNDNLFKSYALIW